MVFRYKFIALSALLIVLLSFISCLTFDPNYKEVEQIQEEADQDQMPGRIVKTKGQVEREKILLSNKIRCVAAGDNNVWVATDSGVSRLSRKNNAWTHYTKAGSLASDEVFSIAIDDTWVWFATDNGVSMFDTESGIWKTFKKKDGLVSDTVQCIAVDGNYIWFGTDGGLNRYDKRIDSWALRSKKDGLSTNNVKSIAVEGEYVWVGTQPDIRRGGNFYDNGFRGRGKPGAGVNRYHRRTDSWNTYSKSDGLADDKLTTIAVGEDEVWLGTHDDGVSMYSKTDQTFVKTYTKTDVLSSNKIKSIAVDGNQIWFGTANAGAQRYLKTVNTWVKYTAEDGLASNHVTWITVHGSEVWFGTYESGLSRYDKISNQWTTYVKADSLTDDDLKVVKADSNGNVWAGTSQGLSMYDPKSREWTNYQQKDGLITDYIMDLEMDGETVWIGTNRGVGTIDEKTKRWRFYGSKDGLSRNFVTSLLHARDDIWAGTQAGLFRLKSSEKKWTEVDAAPDLSKQLITDLAFDGKSHLWVGTEDGIWRYETAGGEITRYGAEDGLANVHINTIYAVDENLVYAGTQKGLAVYKDGKWEAVPLELPSENIRALVPDGKILWLGTLSGLARYDREQNRVEMVDVGDGSSQCNIRSISIKDDSLWLGTTAGLIQVSRSDGSLTEVYRSSLVREPLWEPGVSNIEFDGDYVWFSNWSASQNGAIIRYDRTCGTWRRFTREDIFRDTKVRTPVEVDRILVTDKYLWFATDYGILRYDKKLDTWKHYTMKDGLAGDEVDYIVESAKGVWACDRGSTSVSRYYNESGKWESIDMLPVPGFPSSVDWVESLEADGPDVWFGFGFTSRFCGLRRYNEDTDTWYYFTRKDGLPSTEVDWIEVDNDRIWVSHGYSGGLSYFDKSTRQWENVSSSRIQGRAEELITGEKSVWIIVDMPGRDNGIVRYDKVNDEWTMVSREDIRDLVEDGDYVWASTWHSGVKRFHIASSTWTTFDDRTGLLNNYVNHRSLKVDEKFVWAGTPRGLSIYDKETETWTSYMQSETLISNEVRAVVADERYVWCGTAQGLSRYDKLYGTWTSFRKKGGRQFISYGRMSFDFWEPEDDNSLVDNDINSLAVDDRYLWVGTKDGASRYDKIADRWDRYDRDTGLPNEDVVAVVVDGYDVWAGTGAGLCKYPRMSDDPNAWITYSSGIEIKPMVVSAEYAKSRVSDEIWSLAADGKYVWVSTRIGVSRYDKGRDTWTTFTQDDGLASDAVSSIAVANGRIWFGSDNGVSIYDKETHDWTIITAKDGLGSDRITCIAVDGDSVWMGTFDAGVSRYNMKKKEWKHFTKADGIAHNSILSIAVDGDLTWFGTNRGLSRYDKSTGGWTTFTQFHGPEDI